MMMFPSFLSFRPKQQRKCLPWTFLCFALQSVAEYDDDANNFVGKGVIGDDDDCFCRSNQTHIAWRIPDVSVEEDSSSQSVLGLSTEQQQQQQQQQLTHRSLQGIGGKVVAIADDDPSSYTCVYQNMTEATQDAYDYLRQHVMAFDLPFLETLGFHDDQDDTNDLPDGLEHGMVGQTISYALRAKQEFNYTDTLPKDIWQEYVLNYASTNEARSNWRPLLWQKLRPLVTPSMTNDVSAVVHVVNKEMWKILAPAGSDSIIFQSGSTPLIFDPMSILAFGYASCTGCSILLVNALRTVGIPARLAGTAAWWQDPHKGNHNWVEVWKDGAWYFLEPSPGQGDDVDDLERPPQKRWFCQPDRFGPFPHNTTLVYAARLDSRTSIRYPVAWEPSNLDVPGEEVSAYYRRSCGITLENH